jgi:hypothetical protein
MISVAREHLLQLVTSSTADIHYFISYTKAGTNHATPYTASGVITAATTTNLLYNNNGATGGFSYDVNYISIFNAHASASNTIKLVYDNTVNDVELYEVTLAAGERLEYSV